MHSTNYRDTLITVAADCRAERAVPPVKEGTIAHLQFTMLDAAPYTLTSDDLLLAVEVARKGPLEAAEFFATSRACLRASPLVKTFGYGIHHNGESRVALVEPGGELYARLLADPAVAKAPGMRNARA